MVSVWIIFLITLCIETITKQWTLSSFSHHHFVLRVFIFGVAFDLVAAAELATAAVPAEAVGAAVATAAAALWTAAAEDVEATVVTVTTAAV